MVVGRTQFLADDWTEGLGSLLAGQWAAPQILAWQTLPTEQLASMKCVSQHGNTEGPLTRKSIFCNLHQLCHISFIRNKSLGLAQIQQEGNYTKT